MSRGFYFTITITSETLIDALVLRFDTVNFETSRINACDVTVFDEFSIAVPRDCGRRVTTCTAIERDTCRYGSGSRVEKFSQGRWTGDGDVKQLRKRF